MSLGMGLEERDAELHTGGDNADQAWTVSAHAFSDLTYISPVVFLYLLKECYIHGTCTATRKFRALEQQVHQVLQNSLQPRPFIVQCLYALPIFGSYSEGFSRLIIYALHCNFNAVTTSADSSEDKEIATCLFIDIVRGAVDHDEKIVVRILEVFDITLADIDTGICRLKTQSNFRFNTAKVFVEQYIFALLESQSYFTAVSLLVHFSIRLFGESFLLQMLHNNKFKAAEKWATFMGKTMSCLLVQEYADRNMLDNANETIRTNNLQQDFPDVYQKCEESSLTKLVEKACWDIAERKTNGDKQLIEYLVYLAMEAGYTEKINELCDRYSLEGFLKPIEPEVGFQHSPFLQLKELAVEDIIWVDEVDGLCNATCHIEGCKVVGIDCEWTLNCEKGSKPNKVSIMQIASDKKAFIFDLIKLFKDIPDVLDNCLSRILPSPRILKLGYNIQCDTRQLSHSYGELECFKRYEMLLDLQNVFRGPRGGLSGLVKKIFGVGLNKTIRNSNWEQRPLTPSQIEYAALDAVVLNHILHHAPNHSPPTNLPEGHDTSKWKSNIILHLKMSKK